MQPEDRDAAYLWDMLDAAGSILSFMEGKSFEAYLQDRMLQLAVERGLEIIGEAAHNVSPEFRLQHPEIPWKGIIGQRNVLAHEYGAIKHDLIWEVVKVNLPVLVARLEPIVPPPPQG
ncbi:MAG: DUF86 domain-containing protein [Methanothrix sp.]|jgi:uncharacterized protein with HEPN domain|nr:DUF86 domain-containing protein [Methanothrix sp.]